MATLFVNASGAAAEAIEREMGGLRDDTRVKLLGTNAARMFRIDIPEKYKTRAH